MKARGPAPKFGEQARTAFASLFDSAYDRSPFAFLCTLLRIEPVSEEEWDPLQECHDALAQYAEHIHAKPGASRLDSIEDRRVALLIYSHLTEVAAIDQVLANALRCARFLPYRVDPFSDLMRTDLRPELRRSISTSQRIRRLDDLEGKKKSLVPILESFYDAELHEAFARSEYVLTAESLRYRTLTGAIRTMPWADAEDLVRRATAFYNAFFGEFFRWIQKLGKPPRERKTADGPTVELLDAADGSLCGVQWISPHGMPCSFLRLHGAVSCNGIEFTPRGEILLE